MFGCCEMLGKKYINEDGSLDPKRLREAREAAGVEEPFTDDNQPCRCRCHQDGQNVLC